MALTREGTVSLALLEVGTPEFPPNSNRTKYGDWYGFNGVPWCAIFISWVLAHAGNSSGFRFASTAASVSWARQRDRLVALSAVRPGDVLVRLYTSTTGHAGMCTTLPRDGLVSTSEGNTSTQDDRNGGLVMHRRRTLSWWHYAIRLDYPEYTPLPPGGNVTVFRPPLLLPGPIAATANDPVAGGAWILLSDGSIYTSGTARYLGAVNGKNYWASRTASHLEVTSDGRYAIVATTGERYGPGF